MTDLLTTIKSRTGLLPSKREKGLGINTLRRVSFHKRLEDFFTEEACEEAGVCPLEIDERCIILGAMNPSYKKVKEMIRKLQQDFSVVVNIKQITAQDWEKLYKTHNPKSMPIRTDKASDCIIKHKPFETNSDRAKKIIEKESENKTKISDSICQNFQSKNIKADSSIPVEIKQSDNHIEPNQNYQHFECDDMKVNSVVDEDDIAIEKLKNSDLNNYADGKDIDLEEYKIHQSKDIVISGVSSILNKCMTIKASDIHIEPLEDRLRIRYRIDGVLSELYSLPISHSNSIVSRIKIMSNLDIAEKRLPQDGRIRCILNDKEFDYRVSTLPGKCGEKVVLRALENNSSILDLGKLVTSPNELKMIRDLGQQPYGIVIVVGPTGSGKSTTLYSILSELNLPGVNISTVEDPVEYTLDGIHQVQVIREKGLDFAKTLRSLMRQDPDIILVGETRDQETAQTAMEAALTGHIVFTTLHANDTATAITRLVEMGIPPYLVGSSLCGVVAQRLVRKVCHSCSKIRKLEKGKDDLAISYGINFAREANQIIGCQKTQQSNNLCHKCGGRGYKGRVGIYEVMKINEVMRELIMKHSTTDLIRENSFKLGGRPLLSYGMELIQNEITTIQEVERVCLLDQGGQGK